MGVYIFVKDIRRQNRLLSWCKLLTSIVWLGPQSPFATEFKVVLEGYHRYFFGVKVKTVKFEGGRRLLCMPAQIIQMMAFTRIMAIWTPAITL